MTKRAVAAGVLTMALVFAGGIGKGLAQESSGSTKSAEKERSKPLEAYRLDFSINELEDGKKINTRQYSMNLNANDSNEIKIGSRVPVEPKQGEFQYLDVGTNIWAKLDSRNDQLGLTVRIELSNFASWGLGTFPTPEQPQAHDTRPVIRQLKISASTLALLGKPMVLGSVDDPNSKRQFQVEVTVTKLR
jgi:3D (Asp-Asp-Asp) domain-containing protein